MGRYCQVSGCSTNCNKENKSLFGFPLKNKKLLKKWLDCIPGEINVTQNTGICEDHFDSQFVVQNVATKNGKIRKMLVKEAYPTIFTNFDPNFKQKSNRKSTENEEEFEHDDHCRFCLKRFFNDRPKIKINELITKRFVNVTSLNLRSSSVYSQFVCLICYRNLRQFSSFRDELVKNQFKLYRHLGALEDCDEGPMGIELEDDFEVNQQFGDEHIEEMTFEETDNEFEDYGMLVDGDNGPAQVKSEDPKENQVSFQFDMSEMPIKSENEDYKSAEMLAMQGIYNNVKQEEQDPEYSIFNIPTWEEINVQMAMATEKTSSDPSKIKKSLNRKKCQKTGSSKKPATTSGGEKSDYSRPQVHIKYGSRLCPICGKILLLANKFEF